jgi:uncharacterized repeat protein (TIGR03806 family)
MRALLPAAALFAAVALGATALPPTTDAAIMAPTDPPQLSAFGFFDGRADKPVSTLIPYSLRTPLFSDYAEKQRFIHLPPGAKVTADATGKLVFPVGTALIKSFGYPDDRGGLKIIETRLLLHRPAGWVALPYVWRADGSDADLRLGGTRVAVTFKKPDGGSLSISYAVPNKNQCKQCHSAGGAVTPVGPLLRNLIFPDAKHRSALTKFGTPTHFESGWDDPASGTLDQRARAYLRVNCGHCHAPTGSASNSGLILDGTASNDAALGIGKRPVAAGRASGDMDFVIEPGKPARSILIHRMKSTDPGIAMPELGRAAVHDEGVKLLENWIAAMPAN